MSGWLRVIGLGPGNDKWLSPEASAALHEATDIVGYTPYVNAVPASVTAKRHPSGNGVEVERATDALRMAASGAKVAVVSGGDAGVFGMASAVFEALEIGDIAWRELDISVIAGITALLTASARIGAPLGHDFCVISLSDYLKPWPIIEMRLICACKGDFAIAIYNPASKTRRDQLATALSILRTHRKPDTTAIIATSIGREGERVTVTTLEALNPDDVDMRSLLIIGSSATRTIDRKGQLPFVYTPIFYTYTSPSPLEGEGGVGGKPQTPAPEGTPHPNPPPQGGREI